jgi:hypothetical protein
VLPQFLDFTRAPRRSAFGHEITAPRPSLHRHLQRLPEDVGSANILTVILEVKNGDIYNPTTPRSWTR